jgi:AcrR family transcriptional regulator
MARGSVATRELLIRTALELFAERGIDNVSLREIGLAAGQANASVLQYYFGNRDGLLRAIVEECGSDASRFETLRPEGSSTVSELAHALVLPLASFLDQEGLFLEFIAAVMRSPERAAMLAEEPSAAWFRRVWWAASSELSLEVNAHRFSFAVTLAVHALADRARWERMNQDSDSRDAYIRDLTQAVQAVLSH